MDLVEPDTFGREVLMYPTRGGVVFSRLSFVILHLPKDFGTTLTKQSCIREEIKSRSNSGFWHSDDRASWYIFYNKTNETH